MKITGFCFLICLQTAPATPPISDFCEISRESFQNRLCFQPDEVKALARKNKIDIVTFKQRLKDLCGAELWECPK